MPQAVLHSYLALKDYFRLRDERPPAGVNKDTLPRNVLCG
jgi:hypothetical protein